MVLYTTNELSFEVPDEGFKDQTLHELDVDLPGNRALGLLVLRTPMPPETPLSDAVRAHLDREAKRLAFYRVDEVRERQVAGSAAVEVLAGWSYSGVPLYVRELHVAYRGTQLTFSMNATLEQQDTCDAYFERMVSTLELNGR
jgi:hypothetical protein